MGRIARIVALGMRHHPPLRKASVFASPLRPWLRRPRGFAGQVGGTRVTQRASENGEKWGASPFSIFPFFHFSSNPSRASCSVARRRRRGVLRPTPQIHPLTNP